MLFFSLIKYVGTHVKFLREIKKNKYKKVRFYIYDKFKIMSYRFEASGTCRKIVMNCYKEFDLTIWKTILI